METLIAILLVSTPLPPARRFPREQYFSDREDNIIVNYQPFYPPNPMARKISSCTLSLWQRGNTHCNFIRQSTLPPSEEIFLVSNIYLTKRITSLYFTSYSSTLPHSKGNLLVTLSLWQRGNSHCNFISQYPSPQRGDSPHEQYISDEEDNFIVLYQLT